MSKAPTLADAVIRETWRPHTTMQATMSWRMSTARRLVASAHKFILDDDMAAFVADLAHGPFLRDPKRIAETLTVMRHGARLPHDLVWIELRGAPMKRRTTELHEAHGRTMKDPWGNKYDPHEESPDRWGFLLMKQGEYLVEGREFLGDPEDPNMPVVAVPANFSWALDDRPIVGPNDELERELAGKYMFAIELLSTMAHGVAGLFDPCILTIPDFEAPSFRNLPVTECIDADTGKTLLLPTIIAECSGTTRYLLALLSAINDIPVSREVVTPTRGFVARGTYKKFSEHTVVRLNIPQRVNRAKLATRITAIIHMRAHEVRGHWRLYQRGKGVLCSPSYHQWGAAVPDAEGKLHASCGRCPAWRTWIEKHQRGDASLGFVTHSYAVGHKED